MNLSEPLKIHGETMDLLTLLKVNTETLAKTLEYMNSTNRNPATADLFVACITLLESTQGNLNAFERLNKQRIQRMLDKSLSITTEQKN